MAQDGEEMLTHRPIKQPGEGGLQVPPSRTGRDYIGDEFHMAAREFTKTKGVERGLLDGLIASESKEAAARFYVGNWPSFNGAWPKTPLGAELLTDDVLDSLSRDELNATLKSAVRAVCSEGAVSEGIPLLDRLVSAGARMELDWDAKFSWNPERGEEAKREFAETYGKNPTLDEELTTADEVRDYVDRVIGLDATIYGKTISRGTTPTTSQYAKSLSRNAELGLIDAETHPAFQKDGAAPDEPKSIEEQLAHLSGASAQELADAIQAGRTALGLDFTPDRNTAETQEEFNTLNERNQHSGAQDAEKERAEYEAYAMNAAIGRIQSGGGASRGGGGRGA